MGDKRLQSHTNFLPNKWANKTSFVGDEDRISQLPDDILVHILSFLPLKEAARTSVLSSRWINLWTHTSSLNFDIEESVTEKIEEHFELLKSEKRKFVKWVDSIIQSNKSPTLKEFKISFPLNRSVRKEITRWLEFALSRQVQSLELDLNNYDEPPKNYCFPIKLLTASSGRASKLQPPFRMLVDCKSLKELTLIAVGMRDGDIEVFLDKCPLLEKLVVHGLDEVSNLEICGSSLMLKHLELVCWSEFESLKISAPSLTTLFVTSIEGLLLENVPMLVNVTATRCGDDGISIQHLSCVLSPCISHLQTLSLGLYDKRAIAELWELPQIPKLKKLVIDYAVLIDASLIRLTAFIRASPSLEEFVLLFNWSSLPSIDIEVKDPIKIPHYHLKVFKFCGYYGRVSDAELLGYILENCVVLEKITVDPSDIVETRARKRFDVKETARNNARQQLQPQVPRHVELVIL